jgi:hypothetical protein
MFQKHNIKKPSPDKTTTTPITEKQIVFKQNPGIPNKIENWAKLGMVVVYYLKKGDTGVYLNTICTQRITMSTFLLMITCYQPYLEST